MGFLTLTALAAGLLLLAAVLALANRKKVLGAVILVVLVLALAWLAFLWAASPM